MGVKTKLSRIGNSRGIRIPKPIVEQLFPTDDVELIVSGDHLEIRPVKNPREGWEEAFKAMAEKGDDKLLDEPTATTWDEEEWEW